MRLDLQDGLLVAGVLALEAGAWMVYRPAAFLLAGLLCLGFAFLIEKAKAKKRGAAEQ